MNKYEPKWNTRNKRWIECNDNVNLAKNEFRISISSSKTTKMKPDSKHQ